jgi:hypothetical protein
MKATSEKAFETYIEDTLYEINDWQKLDVKLWDKVNVLITNNTQ